MRLNRKQLILFLVVVISLFYGLEIFTGKSATLSFKKWFEVRMPQCAESSMVRFTRQGKSGCFVFKADKGCLGEVEKVVLKNTSGTPLPLGDPRLMYALIREDALFVGLLKSNTPIIVRRGVGGKRDQLGVTFVTDEKTICWVFVSPL